MRSSNGVNFVMKPLHLTNTQLERFVTLIDKGEDTDCWNWLGSVSNEGYGRFTKKNLSTHRIMLYLTIGPYQGLALHTCGNRQCCNPNHLYAGSNRDNVKDALKDGTHPVGEKHPHAKLTCTDVKKIRRLLGKGLSNQDIARRFSVSAKAIYNIKKSRTWVAVQ